MCPTFRVRADVCFTPKEDIVEHGGNVRLVPKADILRRSEGRISLFDHLVGVDDKRLRNREAEPPIAEMSASFDYFVGAAAIVTFLFSMYPVSPRPKRKVARFSRFVSGDVR
jgi:hypothetical protein